MIIKKDKDQEAHIAKHDMRKNKKRRKEKTAKIRSESKKNKSDKKKIEVDIETILYDATYITLNINIIINCCNEFRDCK
jgi:CRISPR/Cas system CSM-associated protein Csm4 (group 5 of RAMP superfamily)